MSWVNVLGFADAENVVASTLNRPIRQLTQRTDWLYAQLAAMGDGIKSIRIPDALLTMGTDAEPSVGDFVYLDPVLRTYSKAVARLVVSGSVFQTAQDLAYATGLLVSKLGNVGVVALSGQVQLGDTNADWDLRLLLEPNEVFRSGPYYLSSQVPGKMTATPKNLSIYLGYFVDSGVTPSGFGGYALMSPQYKDVGEAHMHRSFPLVTQPAGSWEIIGTTTNAAINGFEPESSKQTYLGSATAIGTGILTDTLAFFAIDNYIGVTITNVTAAADSSRSSGVTSGVVISNDTSTLTTTEAIDWQIGDQYRISARSRLIVFGNYTSEFPTTYTLTLTDSTGVAAIGSGYPVNGTPGFQNVYLHWQSGDPEEGSGTVQLTGYETVVPIGTKGLVASLENALAPMAGVDTSTGAGWNYAEADASNLYRRQWVIEVPTQTVGWRARRFRQFCDKTVAIDGKFSLQLFGSYFVNPYGDLNTQVTAVMGRLYKIAWTTAPVDGDTVTIGDTTYEFDTNGVVASNNIAVAIASLDAADSYSRLLAAVLEQNVTGTYAAIDKDQNCFGICLSPTSQSVTLSSGYTGGTLSQLYAGTTGSLGGAVVLMVYDSSNNLLVTTTSFWSSPTVYRPIRLKNNLWLMFVPFLPDATPSTGSTITAGDTWTTSVVDEAPGAVYQYAVDCDQNIRPYYPPTPLQAAELSLNGADMPNKLFYPYGAFQAAYGGLYWMWTDVTDGIPWSTDWASITSPGAGYYCNLYLAHMRLATTSVVTSVQPAPGSPISITRCGTNAEATVGDLQFDINLDLKDVISNLPGYQVYKQTNGKKLIKGPVVSKIIAGPGIDIASFAGAPLGVGEVMISTSNTAFSGDFEEVALQNAKQEMIGLFPYIRLLDWTTGSASNVPTGLTAKFLVPYTLPGEYQVAVYFTVFGELDISGTGSRPRAGLSFGYNVLRNFDPQAETFGTLVDNLIEPQALTAVEIPLGIDGGTLYDGTPYVYKAFQPMMIHNNTSDTADDPGRSVRCLGNTLFPKVGDLKGGVVTTYLSDVTVQAGSAVAITVQRAGISSGTEYTGKLGILRLRWQLIRVS